MASPNMTSLFGVPIPDDIQNSQDTPQSLAAGQDTYAPQSHSYEEQSGKHKGAAGIGRDILGTLGDFLLTRLHMKPMYWPGQEDRKLNAAWQGHEDDPQAALDRVTDVNFKTGNDLRNTYTDNERLKAAQENTAETRALRIDNAQNLTDMKASGYASATLNTMSTWDDAKRKQFYPQLRQQIILAGKGYGSDFSSLPETYTADTAPILEGFISGAVPVATQRQQTINQAKAAETGRHNLQTEDIGDRNATTNEGKLVETGRHNLQTEDIGQQGVTEKGRHNLKVEDTTQQTVTEKGSHDRYIETKAKPSAADISALRAHPELRDRFDGRFGLGTSKRVLGN